MVKESGLSNKQARFVEEYLLDLNATAAAKRAGYADSTAEKRAPLWVGKSRERCPDSYLAVWDAVDAAKAERSERVQVTQDQVIAELAKLGFCTAEEAKEWKDLGFTFHLSTKTKALELLGRHMGLFTDRIEIPDSGGVLRVPETADPDAWERAAAKQQAALVRKQHG